MKKKTAAAAVMVVAAGAGAGTLVPASPAAADSPLISASNGQCRARWYSASDSFRIHDVDIRDSDYCYVQYGYSSGGLTQRVSIPQDHSAPLYRRASGATGQKTVWWKLCKERQNDPDICSTVRSDAI